MQVTEESCHCVLLGLAQKTKGMLENTGGPVSHEKTGLKPKPQLLTQTQTSDVFLKNPRQARHFSPNTSTQTGNGTPLTLFHWTLTNTLSLPTEPAVHAHTYTHTRRQHADIGNRPTLLHKPSFHLTCSIRTHSDRKQKRGNEGQVVNHSLCNLAVRYIPVGDNRQLGQSGPDIPHSWSVPHHPEYTIPQDKSFRNCLALHFGVSKEFCFFFWVCQHLWWPR